MRTFVSFLFCISFLFGQRINNGTGVEIDTSEQLDVCAEFSNKSLVNINELSKCIRLVSSKIDNLMSQKTKPKEQIKYWKTIKEKLANKIKLFEKAKKRNIQKRQIEIESKQAANISGCNPDSVYVNPHFTKNSSFKNQTVVRIINEAKLGEKKLSININSAFKEVASNLCYGGSLSIYLNLGNNESNNGRNTFLFVSSSDEPSFNKTYSVYIIGNYGYINGRRQIIEGGINVK